MTWAAGSILVLALAGLAISLYFVTLLYTLPAWITRALGATAAACGIDGGSCRRVVGTRYARLFGGPPNVLVGVAWYLLLLALSATCLATGVFPFWWPCLAIAAASVVVGVYLTWVLLFVLHDPCPL